ncbi:MAG TPA: FxsA family protein [Sandaracinaceae bacterium]
MAKLFLLFVVVPLVELYLLLVLGRAVGFWPTVGLVLGTAALGTWFGKREGLRVFREWRDSLARGEVPEEGILGGLLVLVGGVLLITPGVLTDLTGLLLLFPPSRRWVAKQLRARLEKSIAEGGTTFVYRVQVGDPRVDPYTPFGGRTGGVIDVEGEVVEERRRGDPKARLGA